MKKQILIKFAFIVVLMMLTMLFTIPTKDLANLINTDILTQDKSDQKQYLENKASLLEKLVHKIDQYKIHYDIDLAGGTKLEYHIDIDKDEVEKIAKEDGILQSQVIKNIAENVRDAIEKRVNPTGTGETIVQLSRINNQEHLEITIPTSEQDKLAEIKRKATRDNRLEFFAEDPKYGELRLNELELLSGKINEEDWVRFKKQSEVDYAITYIEELEKESSEVGPQGLKTALQELKEGEIKSDLIGVKDSSYTIVDGQLQAVESGEDTRKILVKLNKKKTVEEEETTPERIEPERVEAEKVHARHILIGYKGAERAADDIIYKTKEAAQKKAEELLLKLKDQLLLDAKTVNVSSGSDVELGLNESEDIDSIVSETVKEEKKNLFVDFAKEFSTGSSASNGGDLGEFTRKAMVLPFSDASFALENPGLVLEVIETKFGFHVIEVLSKVPEKIIPEKIIPEETKMVVKTRYDYEVIQWNISELDWKKTDLGGKQLTNASQGFDQGNNAVINLSFDSDGKKLFKELTSELVYRAQECPYEITDPKTGNVNTTYACRLGIQVGREWITRPTAGVVIYDGRSQISGNFTLVTAQQMSDDLMMGAIDAPMVFIEEKSYEASFGENQLRSSLKGAAIGLLFTMIFLILMYRVSGLVACLALLIYVSIYIAILKLWPFGLGQTHIVLSLSGAAGMAISIGLAVDGNILIFERMKEELRRGRTLQKAVDYGFERAWTAIRDSNLTTLFACAVLYWIGSQVIKGFSITLAIGTLVSMFTAIVISRNLLKTILLIPWMQSSVLFGVSKKKVKDSIKEQKKTGARVRKLTLKENNQK